MDSSFNLIAFLRIVWRWRKPILIICGVAILATTIISDPHIMKPYYESDSVFYPLNPNLTSSSALFELGEQSYFGGSNDVDRILSIANSEPLKLYLIHKFKLFQHYDIDSSKENYPVYTVMRELEDNMTVEKNEKGAVVVTVIDHGKKVAADMANEIVDQIDIANKKLLNENKTKILTIYAGKLKDKEAEVKNMTDTIFYLKHRFNLYGGIDQLDRLIKTSEGTRGSDMDAASEQVKVLEEKKKGSIRELNNTQSMYEQYKSTINDAVPTLYILEKAIPAERKSKPIRWLIVLGSALISFVLGTLAVILIERYKYIKAAFADVSKAS